MSTMRILLGVGRKVGYKSFYGKFHGWGKRSVIKKGCQVSPTVDLKGLPCTPWRYHVAYYSAQAYRHGNPWD